LKSWWLIPLTTVSAFLLTGVLRKHSAHANLLDIPNSRSSHTDPMPGSGGLSIAITVTLALFEMWREGIRDSFVMWAIVCGGVVIALVGYRADRNAMSISLRLACHLAVATWCMYLLGNPLHFQVGERSVELGHATYVLGVVALVWALNLFNFMDGIDGIAASEAVFVTAVGGGLALMGGISPAVASAAFIVAAASSGFLVWNWPPAKIFMGDVGSGYLGYVIAVLALASARENGVMIFVWLILGGVFFVDATVTLVRRLVRGERVYEAHRTHAYQWLSRRWCSHLRVTIVVWAINICWLLPMAWLCVKFPQLAVLFVLIALGPLIWLALLIGAGKPETPN